MVPRNPVVALAADSRLGTGGRDESPCSSWQPPTRSRGCSCGTPPPTSAVLKGVEPVNLALLVEIVTAGSVGTPRRRAPRSKPGPHRRAAKTFHPSASGAMRRLGGCRRARSLGGGLDRWERRPDDAPEKTAEAQSLRAADRSRASTSGWRMDRKGRCDWVTEEPAPYHDEEWGRAVHDDGGLRVPRPRGRAGRPVVGDGAPRKREAYRRAFDRFAALPPRARRGAPAGPGHDRAKVVLVVENAKAFLDVQREHGSFDAFAWSFVEASRSRRRPRTLKDIPATTPESDAFSKALRACGFRFVGSTISLLFMGAARGTTTSGAVSWRSAAEGHSSISFLMTVVPAPGAAGCPTTSPRGSP